VSGETAITGLGLVTPNAVGVAEVGARLRAAEPTWSRTSDGSPRWLGQFGDFVPDAYVDPMVTRRMDPGSVRAVIAAGLALADAGLAPRPRSDPDPATGVAMGTAYGCQTTSLRHATRLLEQGPYFANPLDFPDSIDGAPAAHVAMHCGLGGPNITCTDGELAGEMALVAAMLALDAGRADSMVVVAGDALTSTVLEVLERCGVLCSTDTPRPPGPYDRDRCGLVPSELVAALVIEDRARAERRGARVYALLSGPGLASEPDAGRGDYPRRQETHERAMAKALERAGLAPEDVDLFSGAGAGLRDLDSVELCAAEQLGTHSQPPWLVGLRGLFGYCPSDGGLRVAAACLALSDGFVPPSLGLVTPEPATRLRWSARAVAASPHVVLHHAAARGGQCASLVLRRP
jgi:3-oxoacyl-[acyl-carrier-protein] synthase II